MDKDAKTARWRKSLLVPENSDPASTVALDDDYIAGEAATQPSKRPGVETASQERDTRGVVPASGDAGSNRPALSAHVPTATHSALPADAPQSSMPATENSSDVTSGGDAPDNDMERAQSIQSVAREETDTGLQRTVPATSVSNVKPAAVSSKANELPDGREAAEAVKKPNKTIFILQNVGHFLKTVVCCR